MFKEISLFEGINTEQTILETQKDICDFVEGLTTKQMNIALQSTPTNHSQMIKFYITISNPLNPQHIIKYELLDNIISEKDPSYEPEFGKKIMSVGNLLTTEKFPVQGPIHQYANKLIKELDTNEQKQEYSLNLLDAALILAGSIKTLFNLERVGKEVEKFGPYQLTSVQKQGLYDIFPNGFYTGKKSMRSLEDNVLTNK